ncbi:LURP-one-related/scramblase family protein [Methanosarcina sp. UBA289]|uniref:LURP-one-related/scramblase family protein n=1 Tax=Methanosarcina sp. UBA289 TaxID=1915574 RepID=UPI0025EED628|nr:LURP-one-related family protein [Methanosarcina sp. UBA289]
MRLFSGRGDNEEEKRHIYRMYEKLVSIGDDYWIENEAGERAFYVDGKALRIRDTLIFRDLMGNDLYKITGKLLRIRDTMDIKRADDGLAATVKKDLINILRDKWRVEIPDGHDMEIRGNILDHEYEIESEGRKIAEVSKKWFRLRDTYGVEIEPGQDNALILAIAAALDQMSHD